MIPNSNSNLHKYVYEIVSRGDTHIIEIMRYPIVAYKPDEDGRYIPQILYPDGYIRSINVFTDREIYVGEYPGFSKLKTLAVENVKNNKALAPFNTQADSLRVELPWDRP